MWQEIIVYIIGIATGLYILGKIRMFFCKKKTRHNRCDDCPGCALGSFRKLN